MTNHNEAATVRPFALAWVSRHLEAGERIVRTEALHGGLSAEMRKLAVGTRSGATRDLVLRTFVNVEHAEDWLDRRLVPCPCSRGPVCRLLDWSRLIRPPRIASICRSS